MDNSLCQPVRINPTKSARESSLASLACTTRSGEKEDCSIPFRNTLFQKVVSPLKGSLGRADTRGNNFRKGVIIAQKPYSN